MIHERTTLLARLAPALLLVCVMAAPLIGADPIADASKLMDTYCTRCHGAKKQKAELNLEMLRGQKPLIRNRTSWVRVIEQIVLEEMPPEDARQPSKAEREKLAGILDSALTNFDTQRHRHPGTVTLHRLNRAEYNNTTRDLLGIDAQPADRFPSDGGGGGGFDNNADTLFIPPLLMERYLEAADNLLDTAIPPKPIKLRIEAEKLNGAGTAKPKARILNTKDPLKHTVHFPKDGYYTLTFRAWGERAGPSPPRLTLQIDGRTVRSFSITGVGDKQARSYEYRRRMTKGRQTLSITLANPHTDTKRKRTRQIFLDWFEVAGPNTVAQARPTTKGKNILAVLPGKGLSKTNAARQNIERFMTRAFRRPVDEAEVDRFMKLFEKADKRGDDFDQAIKLAFKGVMVSPSFLFRTETVRKPTGDFQLGHYEVANRLSYFLWSSMPDQTLFKLAAQKKLQDPAVLEAQAQRMLEDPKARALAENFAGQWLETRDLGTRFRPDRKRFPDFTIDLRNALKEETTLFMQEVLTADRPLTDLIDADYTFANEAVAKHYGIKGIKGRAFKKVRLPNRHRGGVLGQASVLAVTSYPLRTSPVLRGRWVLDQLLGTPPPPPPMNVLALPADDRQPDGLTFRKRLELHRRHPQCANCHDRIDPVGFGLENFDAVGKWRTKQNGKPIKATGKFPDGTTYTGPAGLRKVLLARKDDFTRNLAEKMLSYALGRGLEYYDEGAIRQILKRLHANDLRSSVLITEVVKSYPFRFRREDPLEGSQR